jgi:putative endonuclease
VKHRWYVYVLYSLTTGRLYTGVSTSPSRRCEEHNGKGKRGAKSTRAGRPWKLVRVEEVRSKSAALKREHEIKKLGRPAKLVLVGLAA